MHIEAQNLQIEAKPKVSVKNISWNKDEVQIRFANKLSTSVPYLIEVSGVEDCNGNIAPKESIELLIPDSPVVGDIIINEILFNPRPEGVDFVELKNVSNNYLDLSRLSLSNGDLARNLIDTTWLIAPGTYAVLTSNPTVLADQYSGDVSTFIKSNIPAMNNDEGALSLKSNHLLMDSLSYRETQHLELLNSVEGVSLERISANVSSLDPNNWVSASSTVGFATPGYENSQNAHLSKEALDLVVEPEIIVPDNMGDDDYVSIKYNLDKYGYLASIRVYNLQGQQVNVIANNETIGRQGQFVWEGISSEGQVVPTGHYIIRVQFSHLDGTRKLYHKKIVVSQGF